MLSDVQTDSCPAELVALLLGKKWVPRIIEALASQDYRFGELVRHLEGSSPKVIQQQLALLLDYQLIGNHKIIENNQISSSYYLSETGQQLVPILIQMKQWGHAHLQCHPQKEN